MPPRRICGKTNTGMNCTTWNSVRANALASNPKRRTEKRIGNCDDEEQDAPTLRSRVRTPHVAIAHRDRRLDDRQQPEGHAYSRG